MSMNYTNNVIPSTPELIDGIKRCQIIVRKCLWGKYRRKLGLDYGPGTVANYASGAFKGLSTMLATHPSLMVPAAAVSFAGEMLASECNKIKDDKNQELEIELRTFRRTALPCRLLGSFCQINALHQPVVFIIEEL